MSKKKMQTWRVFRKRNQHFSRKQGVIETLILIERIISFKKFTDKYRNLEGRTITMPAFKKK